MTKHKHKSKRSDRSVAPLIALLLLLIALLIYAERPEPKPPEIGGGLTQLIPPTVPSPPLPESAPPAPEPDRTPPPDSAVPHPDSAVAPPPAPAPHTADETVQPPADGDGGDKTSTPQTVQTSPQGHIPGDPALKPAQNPLAPEIAPAAPARQAETRHTARPRHVRPRKPHGHHAPPYWLADPCSTWQRHADWCSSAGARPGETVH